MPVLSRFQRQYHVLINCSKDKGFGDRCIDPINHTYKYKGQKSGRFDHYLTDTPDGTIIFFVDRQDIGRYKLLGIVDKDTIKLTKLGSQGIPHEYEFNLIVDDIPHPANRLVGTLLNKSDHKLPYLDGAMRHLGDFDCKASMHSLHKLYY